MRLFGIYALTDDGPEGMAVFGLTKAAIAELFITFVGQVHGDEIVCGEIVRRQALPRGACPLMSTVLPHWK
jgi:hypothetical protein